MNFRTAIACAALALTAACGSDSEMPTAEQDRGMNDAAAMLDKAPDSLSNVDESGLSAEREVEAAAEPSGGD